MSTPPLPPLFLSDEAFDLLVRKVPAEVLKELPANRFEEIVGLPRDRFEQIVTALGADGRTQGFIGPETAGYLQRALHLAILECEPAEFLDRTGVEREDAANMLQQLRFRLGSPADGVVEETR